MKSTTRFTKAAAVVVIIGIGLLHNIDNKAVLLKPFSPIAKEYENITIESDTLNATENKLFIYTKTIIKTSIYHLISII